MAAGKYDRRITIETRTVTQDPIYGANQTAWATLATVWAEVRDILPSRAENMDEGLSMARKPARVRMRYRDDITADMRIDYGGRKMRIVSGPAELGRRREIELLVEELSTEGDAP